MSKIHLKYQSSHDAQHQASSSTQGCMYNVHTVIISDWSRYKASRSLWFKQRFWKKSKHEVVFLNLSSAVNWGPAVPAVVDFVVAHCLCLCPQRGRAAPQPLIWAPRHCVGLQQHTTSALFSAEVPQLGLLGMLSYTAQSYGDPQTFQGWRTLTDTPQMRCHRHALKAHFDFIFSTVGNVSVIKLVWQAKATAKVNAVEEWLCFPLAVC